MTQLSDILQFYMGCQVETEDKKIGWLSGIDHCTKDRKITMLTVRFGDDDDEDWTVLNEDDNITRIKPILRKLSSMTEEEKREYFKLQYGEDEKYNERLVRFASATSTLFPETFVYLLSKSFDLFQLIENGFAIDQDTLKS